MAPSISNYKGVHQRPLGIWGAQIRDPETKRSVWLGKYCCECTLVHYNAPAGREWWCG
jgi:hypothetical protein